MALLNREVTRTIKNTTETTSDTTSITSGELSFVLTTSDFFYVGFFGGPFAARYFDMGTANTNSSTLTVEFMATDGTWTAVEDLVDETQGFQQSGFIHWQNTGKWKKNAQSPVSDRELYWIRISVSADLSAGTTLQSVLNLFSDDNTLRSYWPELITDTRFLPTGRTDFLEQHNEAKEMVVEKMKQRHVISEESQILDLNEVYVAATHAAAYIILNPIARTDEMVDLANRALDAFNMEINSLKKKTDQNKDGVISSAERLDFSEPEVLRR